MRICGKGDEVKLLEVLEQLVVVVSGDRLADDAAEQDDGQQEEFDEREGAELRKPIGGLTHGQRIVDASKCVSRSRQTSSPAYSVAMMRKMKHGAAFDRLQHEVGDWINVAPRAAASEVAVGEHENHHRADDAPEGKLVQDVRDAEAGQRENCAQVVAGPKTWWTTAVVLPPASAWAWLQRNRASRSRQRGALRYRGQRLDRQGKEHVNGDQREQPHAAPDQPVVEKDSGPRSCSLFFSATVQ